MRRIDILVLICGIIGAATWMVVSGKDGYKSSNATIVARSISVNSTIDGQVENDPPRVGQRVKSDDLLVRIQNGRIDRSKLVEFESLIASTQAEIINMESQQRDLELLINQFNNRANSYSKWMLEEVLLKSVENTATLEIAKQRHQLMSNEVNRTTKLYKKKLASQASMQSAQAEAIVSQNQVQFSEAQLKRNELLYDTLKRDGIFFENGDASYWAKMVDTLNVRIIDNANKIASLRTQLTQITMQTKVERLRIETSFAEEHRSPFSGMVNAAFVTKGTRVTSGTSLYQMLDCTQPIIIIPIPDNRVSEFSVGLRVTVYPTDTEQELPGRISYVTSGPLIGTDTSIQVQEAIVLNGIRAVVALDDTSTINDTSQLCESERKAIVVIHTETWYKRLIVWASSSMPKVYSWVSFSESTANEGIEDASSN